MHCCDIILVIMALLAGNALGFGNLEPIKVPCRNFKSSYASEKKTPFLSSSSCKALSTQCIGGIDKVIHSELALSLFRGSGKVPFFEALGLNIFLFSALQPKLFKMLTPSGYVHSFFLGTMLWNTVGWRGWTLCVCYLFFGQAVTKVRFAKKEKMGIAESRGGRRGPENVW